ncbi:MAG TPA: helix-turn-helix domain-containing protein [Spirochaetia bacterium]|nr:helix-turn-helix domain-containing protein [Spirochaetia bacterium]
MKQRAHDRTRTMRGLVLSYVALLVLPLALLTSVYLFMRGELAAGAAATISLRLSNCVERMRYTLDVYYERAQAVALATVQNDDLLAIIGSGKSPRGSNDAGSYRIASQLHSTALSNDFIADIAVRLNDFRIGIGQSGYLSDARIFEEGFTSVEADLPYAEWLRMVEGFAVGRTVCLGDGTLYFLRTYPVTPRDEKSRCIVIIKFKPRILSDLLKEIPEGSAFTILDDEGPKAIFSTDGRLRDRTLSWDLSEAKGEGAYGGFSVAYAKSSLLPITYVSSVPRERILAAQRRASGWASFVFAACALSYAAFFVYFARRNLDPLRRLLAAVKGEKSRGIGLSDPYAEIETMLVDAAAQRLALADLKHERGDLERRDAFLDALEGRKGRPEALALLGGNLGFDCRKGAYCLVELRFEGQGDEDAGGSPSAALGEGLLSRVLAEDFAVTSSRRGCSVLFTVSRREGNPAVSWPAGVEEGSAQVQHYLRDNSAIETLIAISDPHIGPEGIQAAYDEVAQAMEFMRLVGKQTVATFSQASIKTGGSLSAAQLRRETLMIGYARAGDFARAKAVFKQILEAYSGEASLPARALKMRIFALVGTVLQAVDVAGLSGPRRGVEDGAAYDRLSRCESLEDFESVLGGLFDELEAASREGEGGAREGLAGEVRAIVEANYRNTELNVSLIADMLGRNLDYVSRSFARATGMGLLDYIHSVRIAQAKALIDGEPEMTIQAVAAAAGYTNCESFIRAFKRREGITPGRYKAGGKIAGD